MSHLTIHVNVAFPSFQLQVKVDVPTEGITTILGPSGSGKTTLLRCLAGLERSPTGLVSFKDQIWQDETKGIFLPLTQRPIGFVFQEPRLFPHLNVRANLLYGWKRTATRERRISLDQVVTILALEDLLMRHPVNLSGGEQQRVAIGRALLTSPQLLLMDEPLSSLDALRKREILPFIKRLDKEFGIPIMYVSHALHEVVQLGNTVVLLKDGKVETLGPLEDVFSQLDSQRLISESHRGAVIDTRISAHDLEYSLTTLTFPGGQLFVSFQDRSIGEQLRVQILGKDVSLVASPQAFHSSVLNVLEGTVLEIGPAEPHHPFVDIKVDVGCPLLATITRKSLAKLGLRAGQKVQAQVKAVALCSETQE